MRNFGIMQNEGKANRFFVLISVEMHLLHDSEDLVSMQRKVTSNVIDEIQTNLSRGNLLLVKFDGDCQSTSS